MNWREWCYRALLLCYPAEFRYEYASEMTQVFRDRMRETPNPLLWFEFIADVALSASREHGQMLFADLRYAARTLRKSPVFAAAAVLTLALGIGANTAIFSIVNAVMLRPLPYGEPERLVRIAEKNDKLGFTLFSSSVLNYLSWREQSQSFEYMGSIGGASFNLTGRGDAEQLSGATISPSIMPLLGLQPVLGRAFQEGEDKPGAPPVAMVAEAFWKRRFGGDRKVVGSTITLDGVAYTVVGIAPAALSAQGGDVFTPLTIDPGRENRLNHVVTTIGKLKRGVSIQQAQAEMDTVFARLARQYPEIKDWGIRLLTFYDWFVSKELRTALLILLGAVALVLLIACANVANLLLSRAASRRKEIAVRTAMGASHGRLARQLLTESLALSAVGGGAGLLVATWAVHLMNGAAVTQTLLPVPEVKLDSSVLLFALGVTLATGLLFGMAPAWFAAKADLNTVLKQGGRSSSVGAGPMLRKTLVAGELALATVLLVGAGLLTQSLLRLQHVRLGFRPENLLTFQVSLPQAKYSGPIKTWGFYRSLLQSLESLPGVKSAAISSGMPFGAGNYTTTPATTPGKTEAVPVDWRVVSPDYFRTMEIPLLRGRTFTEADADVKQLATVVSQQTAQRMWGAADPLGRVLRFSNGREFVVVGVAGGVRLSLNQEPAPAIYIPAVLRAWPLVDVLVRTSGKPESALAGARQKLRELDAELPMSNVRTMEQWLDVTAAQPRLNAVLLTIFSGIAMLIAAIGIYGVLSYSVTQRTREIGLRIAIGAQPSSVLGWIVREGMLVALAGICAGVVGALAVSRLLATLLFGIAARDPGTFAGVAVSLAVVAGAACYVPARRASRVDPIVALREE